MSFPQPELSFPPTTGTPPSDYRMSYASNTSETANLLAPQPQYEPPNPYRQSTASTTSSYYPPPPTAPPKPFTPMVLRPMFVGCFCAFLVLTAVAVEAVLWRSNQQHGFKTSDSINSFGSTQFLKSFLGVAAVMPFVKILSDSDEAIRRLQAHIDLARGNAPARTTLLLDYIAASPVRLVLSSLRNKHFIVFTSAMIGMLSNWIQPFAGSLFTLRLSPIVVDNISVMSNGTIGLNPDLGTLSAFVAAAGYVEAAVVHKLGDPPFIQNGWAVPRFNTTKPFPGGGTIQLRTPAIQTDVRCSAAETFSLQADTQQNTFVLSATWNSCTASQQITNATSLNQYGVEAVPNCVPPGATAVPEDIFKPVLFWFLDSNGPKASAVFCAPKIDLFFINGEMDMSTNEFRVPGVVSGVKPDGGNVTSSPVNGQALNGVIFSGIQNQVVLARALATQSIVPNAIFQAALALDGGLETAFGNPTIFQDLTTKHYKRFLAIVAASSYFTGQPQTISASIKTTEPRLWVDPSAAHPLAAGLIVISLASLFMHIAHQRARRSMFISAEPGTIAGAMAIIPGELTGLLHPGDNQRSIEKKLRKLRFGLNPTTWEIEARDIYGSKDFSALNRASVQTPSFGYTKEQF